MWRLLENVLHGGTPRGETLLRRSWTGRRPLALEPLESRQMLTVIHVDVDRR